MGSELSVHHVIQGSPLKMQSSIDDAGETKRTDLSKQRYATASLAYDAWLVSSKEASCVTPSIGRALVTSSDPVSGLEARETFRKLRTHFQMFGFLTDATLDGFIDHVLRPNMIKRDFN